MGTLIGGTEVDVNKSVVIAGSLEELVGQVARPVVDGDADGRLWGGGAPFGALEDSSFPIASVNVKITANVPAILPMTVQTATDRAPKISLLGIEMTPLESRSVDDGSRRL